MASRLGSCLLIAFVLLACIAANAQPVIRKSSVSPTSPASGQEMFKTYCASCHGQDGKGHGPAAPALKKNPANLTELSARNGGKFPERRVFAAIKGDAEMPVHGSKDMPVWGTLFSSISHGSEGEVQLRITNLTSYIESIQVK